MRVLVCGGRAYSDNDRLCAALNKLHADAGIDLIIEGGANGADRLARQWAYAQDVRCETFEADWEHQGGFAGPMRNKRMLHEGKPDLVIAFPTPGAKNTGTRGMMKLARDAGVKVIEIET